MLRFPSCRVAFSPKGVKTCCITGGQLENACVKEAVVEAQGRSYVEAEEAVASSVFAGLMNN